MLTIRSPLLTSCCSELVVTTTPPPRRLRRLKLREPSEKVLEMTGHAPRSSPSTIPLFLISFSMESVSLFPPSLNLIFIYCFFFSPYHMGPINLTKGYIFIIFRLKFTDMLITLERCSSVLSSLSRLVDVVRIVHIVLNPQGIILG